MEDDIFFPAAVKALKREDWEQIARDMNDGKNPLLSAAVEDGFKTVRRHIFQLEEEAEAVRG
ncbi:hypothetical protein [Methylocapsa palsarum]|nr:hypothetical protein [Methylocapsa palsarum]